MDFGNKADDGGHLTLAPHELEDMKLNWSAREKFMRQFYGPKEFINGEARYCGRHNRMVGFAAHKIDHAACQVIVSGLFGEQRTGMVVNGSGARTVFIFL